MTDDRLVKAERRFKPGQSTANSLLSGLQGNDAESWVRLTFLYSPLVAHWCRQLHVSIDDTPDVVQEVFQTVVRKIASFEKSREGDSFRAWLRTITRSRVVDHFRRQNRQPHGPGGTEALLRIQELPEAPPKDSEPPLTDHPVLGAVLENALSSIRGEFQEQTWMAFSECVLMGRAPVDVAADLDMQPGTVRVAKCRVLKRLRKELGERCD